MKYVQNRKRFQDTLPYGSDSAINILGVTYDISIHTPLREWVAKQLHDMFFKFQYTLPYGSDSYATASVDDGVFQYTLPDGSDSVQKQSSKEH